MLFAAGMGAIMRTRIDGGDGLVGLGAFVLFLVGVCILFPYLATLIASALSSSQVRVQGQGAIPWAQNLVAIASGLAIGDAGLLPPIATASLVVGMVCVVGAVVWRIR